MREALTFLDTLTKALQPRLNEPMLRRIGGSIKLSPDSSTGWRASAPRVIEVASSFGKRCKFLFLLSLWEADEQGGATVWWFKAEGRGPGRVERQHCTRWRISRHALVRLVQRAQAHEALKLLYAMLALAAAVVDAMADSRLDPGDGQTLRVPFPGGVAVLGWPEDSTISVVKTVLPVC